MKTNSIQFKFLATVISAMLVTALFIGGMSLYRIDSFVRSETENYIRITCEKEAAQVNDIFGDMEKAVNIMSGYILSLVDSVEDIRSPERQKELIQNAESMFTDVANYTDDAVAYYLRLAPEISDGKTGFFYSKISDSTKYFKLAATDISFYDKDDTEHVGWFWQPYEAGKPIWLKPYYNQNNGVLMISYVVPLYSENRFIGVVGMDFDYTALNDKVSSIRIYENGFAHLEMDGVLLCKDGDMHVGDLSEEYWETSADLVNGMKLVFFTSKRDISRIRTEIESQILYAGTLLMTVFGVITFWMVRNIVKPLRQLTEASKKLADGDYDVEHITSKTYEIQLLSTVFENMAMRLQEHQNHQYLLAHIDSMTGLKNTTSYNLWVNGFNEELRKEGAEFGVIVLDVNDLKRTNDIYGHDAGNRLITEAARIIGSVFGRSPVFRIGGDEFVVVLEKMDLANYRERCALLNRRCANTYVQTARERIPVSIASGFARFDPAKDTQYMDVFNRADEEMYRNKKRMKEAAASGNAAPV